MNQKLTYNGNKNTMRNINSNPGLGSKLPSVTIFGGRDTFFGIHLCHHLVVYIFKQRKILRYVDKYHQPTASKMAQINTKHILN